MQLSQEDNLRINVLLNQALQAIRIDEGKMIVYGLTERGEAKIQLNPNCKDEQYIKRVRELISSHVLGSPGGYPVYLKRWTRMGQARSQSLENLLKIGEPEAIIAVVGANGITNEIARRAWWAMPNSDNARRMLARPEIAQGSMGKVLADFLLEFLPFEEEPGNVIESVRLVLQPGLVDDEIRQDLWKKGQRKNAYLVGFLFTTPDSLPQTACSHPRYEDWQPQLSHLAEQNNRLAGFLKKILAEEGQAYLRTVETVIKKPANQDVIVSLFEAIEKYFAPIRPHTEKRRDIEQILSEASQLCTCAINSTVQKDIADITAQIPDANSVIESLFVVSCCGEQLLAPIFARTDSVGSVMRRKLDPVLNPVNDHINRMLGK
jgi:hypothetical protein